MEQNKKSTKITKNQQKLQASHHKKKKINKKINK